MSKFFPAVSLTLVHEGGYSNNPADKGGPTNFGITQADMPLTSIEKLTADQAAEYYLDNFWKANYSAIENQDVCNKVFDTGVLFGVGTAIRIAQEVLAVLQTHILDDTTVLALNERGEAFLEPYKSRLVVHAKWIADVYPTQKVFLNGWINRINS